jgi:exodeoxyribonuclease VII small subunit
MAENKVNFEQKLDRLNEIVTKIENETLPLETSISLYQEGLKLIKELETELKDAEKKIGQYKEVDK